MSGCGGCTAAPGDAVVPGTPPTIDISDYDGDIEDEIISDAASDISVGNNALENEIIQDNVIRRITLLTGPKAKSEIGRPHPGEIRRGGVVDKHRSLFKNGTGEKRIRQRSVKMLYRMR
ncbi:hypothetical protein ROHU_013112 [Labeo rohita]|uniref:Uncharacterized protein n=1 Tax=Labeo rohita TaxID=84645 RepID=A0A498L6P6_LABRO|nr:hypothetical protein ROHU_013112 [Labeo rohita]